MVMVAPILMHIDPEHLQILAQWFSPSFPVGAYSYSHGLEALVDTGQITDAGAVTEWLADVLEFGAGRNDLILLAAAWHAEEPDQLTEIDSAARAMAASAERLLETVQQGGAFSRTVNGIWGGDLPPLTYPVATGTAARRLDIPLDATALFYLHAFAGNLAAAAIRLIPLGQTEGQDVQNRLAPLIRRLSGSQTLPDLFTLGGSAFLGDIASMSHETQYSRIFRS